MTKRQFSRVLHAARRHRQEASQLYYTGPSTHAVFVALQGTGIHPDRRIEFAHRIEEIGRAAFVHPRNLDELRERMARFR